MRTIVAIGVAGAAGTLARYGLEGLVSRRVPDPSRGGRSW
jgi:fluoride ion exporter CrcB/FEX